MTTDSDIRQDGPAVDPRPRVAVVLCTFRGQQHLAEQLESIQQQSWPVNIRVHDDASDDNSVAIAQSHPAEAEVFAHTSNLGYVGNFARGIAQALDSGADYIALSDQDDVWHSDRIAAGMERLLASEQVLGAATPHLAHSDLVIVDEHRIEIASSFVSTRGYDIDDEPNLARVLGQNGVMGNTCLMNRALAMLALPFPTGVHVHDWWLAVVAELYGRRCFVPDTLVSYRLHSSNASNPAGSINPGASAALRSTSLHRVVQRNFKLPFKEDCRTDAVGALLECHEHRPRPSEADLQVLRDFHDYLCLSRSRAALLAVVLKGGFLKRGFMHRLRVAVVLLITQRYRGKHIDLEP